jgi:hypothetical protein
MKLNIAHPSAFLWRISAAVFLILAGACNIREDILLPPDLDPKAYVKSRHILVYSDHLIPSENDDAFLYLPKTSIADHLVWYKDEISFRRVDSFLQRDSLAINAGSNEISATYRVEILRDGKAILLESVQDFATIYCDILPERKSGETALLALRYILEASPAPLNVYARHRAFFSVDGSGDFALTRMSDSASLEFMPATGDVQGLLYTAESYLQIFMPSAFLQEVGNTHISLAKSPLPAQSQIVQELYPGFALLTKILEVHTQNDVISENVPIIHYHLPGSSGTNAFWLKLHEQRLDSWQSSEQTWLFRDDTLISFINQAGSYMLIESLADQESFNLALDAGYRRIYLEDLWVDTSNAVLNGGELQISLNPDYSDLVSDYFGGKPYSLNGEAKAFDIRFEQNDSPLESLPDDMWVEFGFAADLANPADYRLMRAYRTAAADVISFKTSGSAYDEQHFRYLDGYLYSGINASGLYLLGDISEDSQNQYIPCLKDKLLLQTLRSTYFYEDAAVPCTAMNFHYDAQLQSSHPWINSSPYTFSGNMALLNVQTIGSADDSLPAGLFLETALDIAPEALVNLSLMPSYPKFVRYKRKQVLEHNSFVLQNGMLGISISFAGYLFNADELSSDSSSRDIAMFSKMLFDDYDLELYQTSQLQEDSGTLRVKRMDAFPDPFAVFQNQYQLAYQSPVYSFEVLDNSDFYEDYQPYVRIKHGLREDYLLFSSSLEDYYRIYSYPPGESADGWHFLDDEGHFAFYLLYDAHYGAVQDLEPHSSTHTVVNSIQDLHLSLYQSQAVIPQEYIGGVLPLGSRLELEQLTSIAPGVDFRSAYRFTAQDAAQNPLLPNFFIQAAQAWPYIYLSIPDYLPGEAISVYYRSPSGAVQEYSRVDSFSENPATEYLVVGNCAVVFMNNPGVYYVQ